MPQPRSPLFAIAAPVRGEAPYLLEWIAYHRALGIEAFLLADNGGTDGTSQLLKELADADLVQRFDWSDRKRFQMEFYGQALEQAKQRSVTGLFFIDVDEFLRPYPAGTQSGEFSRADAASHRHVIAEIARRWLSDPGIGAVALNWAIYGSSGRTEPGDGLVIERFRRRALQTFPVNRHAKAFVRVTACAGPADNPHAVLLRAGRYTDSRGDDVVWDTTTGFAAGITAKVIWDVLRVDHFIVKSRQEFAAKSARGTLGPAEPDWDRYFDLHNRNDVEDPVLPELIDRTKTELAKIASRLDPFSRGLASN